MSRRPLMILALVSLLFGCGSNEPYQRKGGVWRFEKHELDVPRGERLTALNRRFARSATRVWYRDRVIEGADPATFQALDEHYARDARRAWWADMYRDGRDYFTTERIRIRPMAGVNAAALKVLASGYAADGATAYFKGETFPVADAASFEPLAEGFARDRVQGYHERTPVAGSLGASFEVVGRHFARDARHVYYADLGVSYGGAPAETLPGADPATFQVLDRDYARDARRAFFRSKALNADLATFQVLDYGYAKASDGVFYYGAPVKGADPASFTVLPPTEDQAIGKDKAATYKEGVRVAGGS